MVLCFVVFFNRIAGIYQSAQAVLAAHIQQHMGALTIRLFFSPAITWSTVLLPSQRPFWTKIEKEQNTANKRDETEVKCFLGG